MHLSMRMTNTLTETVDDFGGRDGRYSNGLNTGLVAIYLSAIGLGWLLAACSAVLWLRKYPGRRIGRRHPETHAGRPLLVLWLAGLALGAYGGSGLQTRYHQGLWVVPAVYVPLLLIGAAAPILIRRWQLRHAATPVGLDGSRGLPPTVV